ncbi:hypothetical protein HDU96_007316 [Phlyctochytrium bullatum]|nr:hypothetical protein HDU96_007316 [Phlyctochytrium bullatum]
MSAIPMPAMPPTSPNTLASAQVAANQVFCSNAAAAAAAAVRLVRPAVPLPGRKKRIGTTRPQTKVPLSPDAVRQKNRDAQRAHRDRVSRKIADLESEVTRLRVRVKELEEENGNLKGQLKGNPMTTTAPTGLTMQAPAPVPPPVAAVIKTDPMSLSVDVKPKIVNTDTMITPAASRHPSSSPTIMTATSLQGAQWAPSPVPLIDVNTQQQQASATGLTGDLSFAVSAPIANNVVRRLSGAESGPYDSAAVNSGFGVYPSPPAPIAVSSPIVTSPAATSAGVPCLATPTSTVSPLSPFFVTTLPVTAGPLAGSPLVSNMSHRRSSSLGFIGQHHQAALGGPRMTSSLSTAFSAPNTPAVGSPLVGALPQFPTDQQMMMDQLRASLSPPAGSTITSPVMPAGMSTATTSCGSSLLAASMDLAAASYSPVTWKVPSM